MSAVLLRYAAKSTLLAVLLSMALSWFVLGEGTALGALLGGSVAAGTFLGWIYIIGRLFDQNVKPASKAVLFAVMFVKLGLVVTIFWAALSKFSVSALGMVIGVSFAIGGFTFGMSRGSASKEGEAAIRAEEEKIKKQMEEE